MFYKCESLTSIDLSNFNTQNVSDMGNMFDGCKLLKKKNIVINDDKIKKELEKPCNIF